MAGRFRVGHRREPQQEPEQRQISLNAAPALKEYGLTDFRFRHLHPRRRPQGCRSKLSASRMPAGPTAHSPITSCRPDAQGMIGDQGCVAQRARAVFSRQYSGGRRLRQTDRHVGGRAARACACLPLPGGNAGKSPVLPQYLPTQARVKNTIKYVLGPVGLAKINAPLPRSWWTSTPAPKWLLGNYQTSGRSGHADGDLLSHAANRRRNSATDRGRTAERAPQPGSPHRDCAGPIFDKRTGPMVVIAAGAISQGEAKRC